MRRVGNRNVCEDQSIQAQEFGQGPGLKRTAARRMWRAGIGDLRHMAESGVVEVLEQRREKALPGVLLRLRCSPSYPNPGFDEGTHEPGPHRTLVVDTVAIADAAFISRCLAGLFGCQRA